MTDESERYDRQIRLWGEGGQRALSRAAVLVIGATATATENLKNLVLPGIASFTIVDGSTCAKARIANFFVTRDDDSPAAAEAALLLSELNPLVRASYIAADPATFLDDPTTATAFVSKYSLVIITQQGEGHATYRLLVSAAQAAKVPFVQVRSYGMLGLVRVLFPDNSASVICDRDDKEKADLRIHAPFPELEKAAEEARIRINDPDTASHVPFVFLLLLGASAFRKEHGALPKTRDECKEVIEIVKKMRPEGCSEEAQNFEEATKMKNVFLCRPSNAELPDNVRQLFEDERSDPEALPSTSNIIAPAPGDNLPSPVRVQPDVEPTRMNNGDELSNCPSGTPMTPSERVRADERAFWVHVAAVRKLYMESGHLPLSGSLPDMTSDTQSYVALQRVFTSKAAADAKAVLAHALEITERRGLTLEAPVDAASVAEFCKTVRQAHVVRPRTDARSFIDAARDAGALDAANSDTAAAYYALFRASDDFYREHGRIPDLDADVPLLRQILSRTKEDLGGIPVGLWSDEVDELVRYGGTELHNVAALMGGIASQEAVKLITKQFVPTNGSVIFNTTNMTTFCFGY